MAGNIIDLTDDGDIICIDHSEARQKIMKQAQGVLQQKAALKQAVQGHPQPGPQPQPDGALGKLDTLDDDDESGKKRRRLHVNGTPASDAKVAEQGNGFFPHPVQNPMNDVLRALHQERMSRHRGGDGHAHDVSNQSPTPNRGQKRPSSSVEQQKLEGTVQSQQPSKMHASSTVGNNASTSQRAHYETPSNVSSQRTTQTQAGSSDTHYTNLKVMTFNIWFQESVALKERMRGLANIILTHQPDVVMLQEVTHNMMQLWMREHDWLCTLYQWSDPPAASYFTLLGLRQDKLKSMNLIRRHDFNNSEMGRDVLSVALAFKDQPSVPPLFVATSHLESPLGRGELMLEKRQQQVHIGTSHLLERADKLEQAIQQQRRQQAPERIDIVWGGDMNWISAHGNEPPLPQGWQDVWAVTHPHDPGHTYDPKSNAMLKGTRLPSARLDRFFGRLDKWRVKSLEQVGREPLEGVTAEHYNKTVQVHVSDHYGLLLTLEFSGDGNTTTGATMPGQQ